jgi:hypothetical protein
MKTDDLITAMVADNATISPPISRTMWIAIAAGAGLAAAVFANLLSVRSDFLYAISHEARFISPHRSSWNLWSCPPITGASARSAPCRRPA